MPQLPGPPGCPHEPQALSANDADCVDEDGDENTDSFLSSSIEWQLGQSGIVLERTSASNSWPHCLHAYS